MTYAKTGDLGRSALSAGMALGAGEVAQGLEGMGQPAGIEQALTNVGGEAALSAPIPMGEVATTLADGTKYYPTLDSNSVYQDAAAKAAGNVQTYADSVRQVVNPENYAQRGTNIVEGAKQLGSKAGLKDLYGRMSPIGLAGLGAGAMQLGGAFTQKPTMLPTGSAIVSGFNPNAKRTTPVTLPGQNAPADSSERRYFNEGYPYAMGGSVPNENQFYPGADIARGGASYAPQAPSATDVMGGYDQRVSQYTGEPTQMASGGLTSLNEYAAGGRLLDGAGDGMSDSIPAVIKGAKPQRAALAQGEFVVPADVVSHLGNGSTKAGSQRLYAMMDKVRHARTGTKKQGKQIKPEQFIPA
jgi:hypothetical protein